MEELQINAVLAQTLELVSRQSAFFNVRIERMWTEDLPAITGDRSQLQQVFLNILVNAVQAVDERGTITIRTRAQAGQIEIAISDTGSGIPPEVIERAMRDVDTELQPGFGRNITTHRHRPIGVAFAIGFVHGGQTHPASATPTACR